MALTVEEQYQRILNQYAGDSQVAQAVTEAQARTALLAAIRAKGPSPETTAELLSVGATIMSTDYAGRAPVPVSQNQPTITSRSIPMATDITAAQRTAHAAAALPAGTELTTIATGLPAMLGTLLGGAGAEALGLTGVAAGAYGLAELLGVQFPWETGAGEGFIAPWTDQWKDPVTGLWVTAQTAGAKKKKRRRVTISAGSNPRTLVRAAKLLTRKFKDYDKIMRPYLPDRKRRSVTPNTRYLSAVERKALSSGQ
jgi:hypothetical protein